MGWLLDWILNYELNSIDNTIVNALDCPLARVQTKCTNEKCMQSLARPAVGRELLHNVSHWMRENPQRSS